jgi:PAS domain S-box-containing protein
VSGSRQEADRRQALLEAAEEVAGGGSYEWIPADGDLLWSDNLYRIFGLEPGEITPTPEYVFAHTHPDDQKRVVSHVAKLREGGAPEPLDYRIVRPDGVVRHLRAALAVAESRGRQPHRVVGWVQDVTERRRAEREIAAHAAVAEALSGWESLDSGAEELLARLADAMDFVAGALWLPRGDVLVAHVVWTAASVGSQLSGYDVATRAARLPRGAGLAGRAWERREPIDAGAAVRGRASGREEAAAAEGLRGAVAIPAMLGEEVLAVVELASREEAELTPRLMRSLTGIGQELGRFLGRRRGELEAPLLTPRELEVLQLAAQGLSARSTAERLVVSPGTVRTHFENIYPKLGVSDKASAVAVALRLGLIS